ncbi:GNAT family N-acetyltransferase [Tateyamaria sp. syn59]|uniref:GNAT family N-acetyltransferase n=1 Tax=Tateyamaria sp. syn59 TaxID=2576942 RepID=UPI001672DB76|nr:GNAT family N-acetyltransferase [Tateyamaria sp. syn59]
MKDTTDHALRPARHEDGEDLARLIDIAGEGIPSWLWAQSADGDQTPLDVGTVRARREQGGFSYKNAIVAERENHVLGMVLSYPIASADESASVDLPAPIVPFVALEANSVGTWYVNALAVRAGSRGYGIGTTLMANAEKQARDAGFDTVSIQVYAQNTAAVRLYRRLGYELVASAPVLSHPCQPYYTGDVLLLLKAIAPHKQS